VPQNKPFQITIALFIKPLWVTDRGFSCTVIAHMVTCKSDQGREKRDRRNVCACNSTSGNVICQTMAYSDRQV
jgi:hypothetical protein